MTPISQRTRQAAQRTVKDPNIVLCIEGAPFCMGSAVIKRIVKIGDPGLYIDGSWMIGGVVDLDGQRTLVSTSGTSTSIKQQLEPDKGRGSSIQSMDIELVDIDNQVTELITPGLLVEDVLGRKAKVYLAIDAPTSVWPKDYLLLFRGVIDDIRSGAGVITLTIAHPEQKKKQAIYPKVETNLTGPLDASQTSITLTDASQLLLPVAGPDGLVDSTFRSYVKIKSEIIEYTGISGNTLTGCVRGSIFTFGQTHAADESVASFYRLRGTAMDLALKIMLTRKGPYLQSIPLASYQIIPTDTGPLSVPNALYFEDVDVVTEYGLTVGEYVSTTGSGMPLNDFSLRRITAIVQVDTGSYIIVSGSPLTDEAGTPALVAFRSRYDSLPAGLGLGADEVDITQHEFLRRQFLSSFVYDIYIKDTIENAREFIEQEIYKPASAYSVPRKAQASAQLLLGPIPGAQITTFNKTNIVNPSKIKLRRTINKNFYNTIVYKYDEDELEDKFVRGVVSQNATSIAQIPVGSRALVIQSKGLRELDGGNALAQSASERRLRRYAYGAEFIEGLQSTFGAGFDVEVGDICIFDPTGLSVSNTSTGTREKPAALFEVVNKTLNWKTGEILVDLLDTAFDENARYGLMGPSSLIRSGGSTTGFTLEQGFASIYGSAEWQKWQKFEEPAVVVRSKNSTTRYAQTALISARTNTVEVFPALPFVPQPGDIMELAPYDSTLGTSQIKLIYGHMSPLTGGDIPYVML